MKTSFFQIFLMVLGPMSQAGNVIFIHPDGAGIAHWQAARFLNVGPDGDLHWDQLSHIAVYRGHMLNELTATSNGGATTHAYGIKVPAKAFGTDGSNAKRPTAALGFPGSLMHEAMKRNVKTGVVNSGSVVEPGTACYLASVAKREDYQEITTQVVTSGADVILSGGEEWFLPKGTAGRHTPSGARSDGENLVSRAQALGYTIVYTADELKSVPAGTKKLLGIFAFEDTFNDMSEEEMSALQLPPYKPGAPTLAEMTSAALKILSPGPFLLVVEEEGADNFGNSNNAVGALEALRRADETFEVARDFISKNPETLLITAADSSAGNFDVISIGESPEKNAIAANRRDRNGAPYSLNFDGKPFVSKPDRAGKTHSFVVNWGTLLDSSGGIVVRGAGKNADKILGSFDNTKIYSLMHETLFDQD
ncbi:MAG: alkaline phosphatase [Gloeobacteraceae cyanobacterium ES-bin-144]|nr:alkaline phosphatase [Verrucomicrobiales bacterium]